MCASKAGQVAPKPDPHVDACVAKSAPFALSILIHLRDALLAASPARPAGKARHWQYQRRKA